MVEQIIMRSDALSSNSFDIEHIEPENAKSFVDQVQSCIDQLCKFTFREGKPRYFVAQQSFFISAGSRKQFDDRVSFINEMLQKNCGAILPATGFMAQHPGTGSELVLELICTKGGPEINVIYKTFEGINYTVVEQGDIKIVHAAGLSGHTQDSILSASKRAFVAAKGLLENEGLSIHHIVRQWNYIESITQEHEEEGVLQNYQIFNDVRSQYYDAGKFASGYPAATGIGMNTGGVVIGFIAISESPSVKCTSVQNPGQIDAHKYSDSVLKGLPSSGYCQKSTPKFERAKLISIGSMHTMYISGTASILGEKSEHIGDVGKQTETTIDNIFRLFSTENQQDFGLSFELSEIHFSHLRVYVKYQKDIPLVKKICRARLNSSSYLFLVSDVCREDLLVEIEGVFPL